MREDIKVGIETGPKLFLRIEELRSPAKQLLKGIQWLFQLTRLKIKLRTNYLRGRTNMIRPRIPQSGEHKEIPHASFEAFFGCYFLLSLIATDV